MPSHDPAAAPTPAMGAPRVLSGRVVPGMRRGHELGFPTANLELDSEELPPSGIYAVWVRLQGQELWRPGAASVGYNPTFPAPRRRMEVHILDYPGGQLYGTLLEVVPAAYLREEQRYDSPEALIRQMELDCARARSTLSALPPPESPAAAPGDSDPPAHRD